MICAYKWVMDVQKIKKVKWILHADMIGAKRFY